VGKLLSVIGATVLLAASELAQSDRGTITGTIADPSGAVIPDTQITLTNVETGPGFIHRGTSDWVIAFIGSNPRRAGVSSLRVARDPAGASSDVSQAGLGTGAHHPSGQEARGVAA
jgi:hypothetical protein